MFICTWKYYFKIYFQMSRTYEPFDARFGIDINEIFFYGFYD